MVTKAKPKPKAKSTKAKPKPKAKPKTASKKAFGGYTVNFAGRKETAEQIFGRKPIVPSEMTKKIWAYVKSNNLSNR